MREYGLVGYYLIEVQGPAELRCKKMGQAPVNRNIWEERIADSQAL